MWVPRRYSLAVEKKCTSVIWWSLIDTHHCWISRLGCHYIWKQKCTRGLSFPASSHHCLLACLGVCWCPELQPVTSGCRPSRLIFWVWVCQVLNNSRISLLRSHSFNGRLLPTVSEMAPTVTPWAHIQWPCPPVPSLVLGVTVSLLGSCLIVTSSLGILCLSKALLSRKQIKSEKQAVLVFKDIKGIARESLIIIDFFNLKLQATGSYWI